MVTKHLIKKDAYFDSVTLMLITTEIKKLPGVENAVVGMGTDYNVDSLKRLGMFSAEFGKVTPSDLLICVQAETADAAAKAIEAAQGLMAKRKAPGSSGTAYLPINLEGAFRQMPDANVVLISVPGNFAAREADIALDAGKHIMMFSDNVTIDEELALKEKAVAKGLLMMGPDCGTAIINNVPLAFANVVRHGEIGLVGASGTGLQEVTSLIHQLGYGITQAIGVGGRDLSEKIQGRMTRLAVKALGEDPDTKVIVLISKPPAESTLKFLYSSLKDMKKPIVIYFIGADPEQIKREGFIAGANLEDTAIKACELMAKKEIPSLVSEADLKAMAGKVKVSGKYVRALYSGGTLCDEAQRQLLPDLKEIYSNTPVKGCSPLKNVFASEKHTIIDLGDDDFTRGKAHPMIDPSLRQERILAEAADPDVAMVLMDVVLGYGSHPDMAGELVAAVEKARKKEKRLPLFAATICGTDGDLQNYGGQKEKLEKAGIHVFPSNVSMIKFVKYCLKSKGM